MDAAQSASTYAHIRDKTMIKALLNSFGFLSILPVGMPSSLEDVAKHMYLFPIVGAVLGLGAGLTASFLQTGLPGPVAAVLGFFALLILTGFHHLDGLLDLGDALIYRGASERRHEILHDTSTGVGGFGAGLFITLTSVFTTVEYIGAGGSAVLFFAASETLAKLAMVISAALGQPAFEGTGSIFASELKKHWWQTPISIVITAGILLALAGMTGLFLLAVPIVSALFFIALSKRLLGGVSGDVFGAANEVTRLTVMLVMLWML